VFLYIPGRAAPRALRARNYFELILSFVLKNEQKHFFARVAFAPRRAAQRGDGSVAPACGTILRMVVVALLIMVVWMLCVGGIVRANRHYRNLEAQRRRGFEVIIKPGNAGRDRER
jgi:hypothetical protein